MLTWIEIDTARIRANIGAFRTIVPAGTAVMVVVKADGYGHGLEVVAPAVAQSADWLGVNTIDEALTVHGLGIRKPVMILGHTEPARAGEVALRNFRQVVYRLDVAAALSRAAREAKQNVRVHIKVETGTNRLGVALKDLSGFAEQISAMPGLEIEGLYTHFANIEDTLDPSFAKMQLVRFHKAVSILEKSGIRPPQIHAAATAGALLYPETGFTMIRVGIGAYGVWPSRETQIAARERARRIELLPALTWKTRIVQLKSVPKGDHVGYGLTYEARRRMQVAVIPVGYHDGYDRKLSNTGLALVTGTPVPVVGRVAMNMTMLDVTDVDAGVDDEVVLIGRQGNAEIHADDLAGKIGTISYELLSRINPRIPRIAINLA